MDFLCGQVSLDVQKKTTKNLSFCIHFHVWICVFICLYDFVHVGVLSFGHARLVFWSFPIYFLEKKKSFISWHSWILCGLVDHQIVELFDDVMLYEAILLTCYDAICIRSGLCVGMICLNYLLRVCVVIKHFCVTVDAVCWEIHATTKDWPLLREREMLITCVAFCLQLSSIKNFRLHIVPLNCLIT